MPLDHCSAMFNFAGFKAHHPLEEGPGVFRAPLKCRFPVLVADTQSRKKGSIYARRAGSDWLRFISGEPATPQSQSLQSFVKRVTLESIFRRQTRQRQGSAADMRIVGLVAEFNPIAGNAQQGKLAPIRGSRGRG